MYGPKCERVLSVRVCICAWGGPGLMKVRGRVSQSNPELGATASCTSQLSPGIPPLPLRLELQASHHTHPTYTWVLGILTPSFSCAW